MVSLVDTEDRRLAREEAYLVSQIAAGDIDAPVEELYHRYAARLYRTGLQQLGDGGLAEELVQECFVRHSRTKHSCTSSSARPPSPSSWRPVRYKRAA